jgi:hypothetical protein
MKLIDWANVATIATAFGIWVAMVQLLINQKQLHLDTIKRCIDEFRNLTSPTNINYSDADATRYIDLVNEELFYFQHNYIPRVVAYEWIDGMLDYIPLFDKTGNILNKGYCVPRLALKPEIFFKDYPRIKHTFTILDDYDFETIYAQTLEKKDLRLIARKNLVESIYHNLKGFNF